MKVSRLRRELLQGLDLTAADVDRPPQLLTGVRDAILTNGRGTKRLGHARYNSTALRRGMLCQRGEQVGAFRKANKTAEILLRKRTYPALGYGLIPWHADVQPKKAGWAVDFRLFTGRFEAGRTHTILDQSIDTGGAQWAQIRRSLLVQINTTGNLIVTMDRYDRTTNAYTAFSTPAVAVTVETDIHVGISYDGANLSVRVNGGAANNVALTFTADQFWAGEAATDAANTENDFRAPIILLNRLYVRRTKATATYDDATPANPYDWFALYPATLDAAPAGAGIYELRFWSTSKDFSSANYPQALRPLTAAEEADAALKAYLRCDEGGGRIARDTKGGHHARLLPGGPLWVDQTGFGTSTAVECMDGGKIVYRSQRPLAELDPLNRELEMLFGDVNTPAFPPSTPTRCAPYTAQFLFRTPKQFELEPQQSYVTAGGAPFNNNVLVTVTKGNAILPVENRADNRLDTPNNVSVLDVFRLYLTRSGAGCKVTFDDNTSTVLSATVLTADTDYAVTVTRSEIGTRSIYLNATVAADASAAGMPNVVSSGSATAISIGHDFDQARAVTRAIFNTISRCERNLDGHFRFKAFRLWKTVLRTSERVAFAMRMLLESERANPDLLVNLEATAVTGDVMTSRCSYPVDFEFEQQQSEHHLGASGSGDRLDEEWWDSWSNAQPPYWGSHAAASTYDPAGAEGQVEVLADYKDAGLGDSHLLTAAHGVLYVDKAFAGTPVPVVPERVSSLRDTVRHENGDRLRAVQAAGRMLLLSERNAPMVWTGKHLVPLGVDLPRPSRLPEGTPTPMTAANILIATTVALDGSLVGAPTLVVPSTRNALPGMRVRIGRGTPRDETKFVASIASATNITLTANLSFTHTTAQADAVEFSIVSVLAGVYSYLLVYRDEERNVIGVLGPTQAVVLTEAGCIIVGSDNLDTIMPFAGNLPENDMRCVRKHLNPRVSSIDLYRNRGEGISNSIAGVDLAEQGPFFFHSTLPNVDQAGIDGLADGSLGKEVFDDRFSTPAAAKHAVVFNGRLILANFALARDFVLPSQGSGKLELFDEAEGFPTEDGTNGEVTGLRAAYGSAWAFKERSIWQLNENANGLLEGQEFTRAVGCIAPDSLVEFFSQATGQRSFFFWSAMGPYLFNGNQPTYIGQALKGDPSITPFFDLLLSSTKDVWAIDVEQLGQIWVFVKPATAEVQLFTPEYRKVLAFDYINGVWLTHTGLRFTTMAPVNVPSSLNIGGIAGADRSSILFAGGYRGYIYTVLTSTRGGDPITSGNTLFKTLSAASTSTSLIPASGTPWPTTVRDLVAMVIRADGTTQSRWILNSSSAEIVPEVAYSFTPGAGDAVIVAPIDFLLQLASDALDAPQVDKQVSILTVVHDGILHWRVAVNHRALTGAWATNILNDANNNRRRVWINRLCQSIILEIRNPFPDQSAALVAWEWEAAALRGAVLRQVAS